MPANAATAAQASEASAAAAAKFAYNPALDGLRVLCIYTILAGHMGAIHASNVAVDVFMVLSGFLITALLLAERSRTGTISIGRFLVRRAYRLMPAMWVYLLVGLAVTVAFKWDDVPFRNDYLGSAASAFLNVNNWYKVEHPAAGGRWLAHVWSLSLEEQFYLLWPGCFLLLTRSERLRPHLVKILLGVIVTMTLWTYGVASGGASHGRIYLGTDTHLVPLLLGCTLAIWRDSRLRALASAELSGTSRRRRSASEPGRAPAVTTAALIERWTAGRRIARFGLPAALVLLALAFLGPDKSGYPANWIDKAAYLPSGLLGATIIMGADLRRDDLWVRLVGAPRMAFLGKITFNIYLWHYPVISAANGQLVPRIGLWPSVVVSAAISTFIAYFSNRWIEKPTQRRRPKWADAPRGPARSAVPAPRPARPIRPARSTDSEDTVVLTMRRPRSASQTRQPPPDPQWEEFDTAHLTYLDPYAPQPAREHVAPRWTGDDWNDDDRPDPAADHIGADTERADVYRHYQAAERVELVDDWADEDHSDAKSHRADSLDVPYANGYSGSNGYAGADYAAVPWTEVPSSEPAYTAELIYNSQAIAAARARPYLAHGGWDQGYGRPLTYEPSPAPDVWADAGPDPEQGWPKHDYEWAPSGSVGPEGYRPAGHVWQSWGEGQSGPDDWRAYPDTGGWIGPARRPGRGSIGS